MKLNRHQKKFKKKNKKYPVRRATLVLAYRQDEVIKYRPAITKDEIERASYLRVTLTNGDIHIVSREYIDNVGIKWLTKK